MIYPFSTSFFIMVIISAQKKTKNPEKLITTMKDVENHEK